MRSLLFSLLLLGPLATFARAQDSAPSAQELLNKLVTSLKTENYAGDFTWEFGSRVESFRLVHTVIDAKETEKLYRLTGSEIEFLRSSPSATCGTLGGRLLAGGELSSSDGQHFGVNDNYRMSVVGSDRIAGRPAWLVNILPMDEDRYGVLLAVDQGNGLLLRLVVFDAQKRSGLERLQFVSMTSGIDPNTYVSGVKNEKPLIEVTPQQCVGDRVSLASASHWKPTWLPSGYVMTNSSYSDDDGYMETYTDGLSSFSLFVRPTPAGAGGGYGRIERHFDMRGAALRLISFLPLEQDPVLVTVVGEIPLQTAQKISRSVRRVAVDPPPPEH